MAADHCGFLMGQSASILEGTGGAAVLAGEQPFRLQPASTYCRPSRHTWGKKEAAQDILAQL